MKKYKNRIVNDLERRLSKIDTEKNDELSISIPTLSLVRDFTLDNIGVFNNEVRDLSHLDESATILNKKKNTMILTSS